MSSMLLSSIQVVLCPINGKGIVLAENYEINVPWLGTILLN
jgi:hypothetical protein